MIERLALRYVNRVRDELGHPPLDGLEKGRPCRVTDCPIANSVPGAHVDAWTLKANGFRYTLPLTVGVFVWLFDRGHYHHLRAPWKFPREVLRFNRSIDHLDWEPECSTSSDSQSQPISASR